MGYKKLYAKRKGYVRSVGILVDESTYSKFKDFKLLIPGDNRVYFIVDGEKKYLARAILNLTDCFDRVFFKSTNKLDMRRSNLLLKSVPVNNRGKYAVQFHKSTKN
jgi:hypothetical protein